ncbi:MAG TPA: extracellular solute-binding protein [Streptosporangiaceae bacterium]|nr:extracellular solute-binding protein [Streptosporangiaceae bacterium]
MRQTQKRWARIAVTGRLRVPLAAAALPVAVLLAAAAGCSSSGPAAQTGGTAKQTITISLQGLGAETTETEAQIAAFEKANPNISVKPLILSPTANTAYQQLTTRFVAGSGTPDVIVSDVVWPATFAKAGWIAPLDTYSPDMTKFFPAQAQTVRYNGHVYGIPWFINAEGLYYRTDLVKTPPTSPQQLVADAQAAMKADPTLKEGLAFEGFKYEGAVTAWQNFLGGFGGKLDAANINTTPNQQALQFEHDAIYKYKIAPTAVTGWQESDVQSAWLSGQTAFAVNWPYLLQLSQTAAPVKGKVGYIPFPSSTGTPAAALGGDDLVINAKSAHQAAAWKFIQFLTTDQQQVARAIPTGDAPAVQSAYTGSAGSELFAKAPFFQQALPLFKVTTNRPVTPNWPQISADLQTMISSVLSNQSSAAAGLSSVSSQIKPLAG